MTIAFMIGVCALVMGGQAPAFATARGTVAVTTQRMSDATLKSGQSGTYPRGAVLTLDCYKRGQWVTGYYSPWVPSGSSNLWYKVSDGYYVADIDINTGSNNPVTPACPPAQTTRETRAVNWANSQLGSTAYNGWCLKFVAISYGGPFSGGYGSALAMFNGEQARGRMHYTTTNIPKGALVWSRNNWDGGAGHVMLSRGDGTFVNPADTVRIAYQPAGGTGTGYRFLGWSYAPDNWTGR